MSKKPSKAKAKRSRAKPQRIPRDPVTGQQFIFDPETGKPTYRCVPRPLAPPPTTAEIAARRERIRQREARGAERRAAFRDRLARRPAEMQRRGYEIPTDVAVFLRRLHEKPTFYHRDEQISIEQSLELVEGAYMEGCRQGFIEGFLYGEDKARPGALKNRERLRQINIDKLVRLGIADRNAEIVAEFHRLERELPGKEQRKEKLAADHDLTPKQIGNILRADKRRR